MKACIIIFTIVAVILGCSSKPHEEESDTRSIVNEKFRKNIKWVGEIDIPYRMCFLYFYKSRIYLWDKFLCKIYVFKEDTLEKLFEFGNRGEGPGEFPYISRFDISRDTIFVSTLNKISCFTLDGKFIRDLRNRYHIHSFIPIGKNFIGYIHNEPWEENKKNSVIYMLFDPNLEKKKEVCTIEYKKHYYERQKIGIQWFHDCYKGVVYKDRFYVASTDRGFYFAVYDEEGNFLYEINKEYKPVPVTSDFKKTLITQINKIDNDPFKRFWGARDIIFPSHFPAFMGFAVDNDSIYVFKHPDSDFISLETVVLNLDGNQKKTCAIPASFWMGFQNNEIILHKEDLYIMDMSDENDNLEIHAYKMVEAE